MTFNFQPPTFNLGLVGYPLGHSLSPRLHRAALDTLGLQGEYRLYPVDPASPGELGELLHRVRTGEIAGLNVTIPHKQTVLPLLDALTPAAQAIGAVNTIFRAAGQLIGDNTDAPGFLHDLRERLNIASFEHLKVLILGAGGSARAVAYALLSQGCHITIAARRPEQAHALATDLSKLSPKLQPAACSLQLDTFNLSPQMLIVNTTPVGMSPHVAASPWPANIPFPEDAAVYDLIYNPRETLLVKQARAAGLSAVIGLGMLIEQAALAFERWVGIDAPRDMMKKAINEPTN